MEDVPQSLVENKSYAAFFDALRQANFTDKETLEYFKQMTDEMCWQAALKYQKQEGLQEGERIGRLKGERIGRQEGLQEGERIGRQDERTKMAKSLKEQGVPAEVIAKASGLSIAEIEKL